MRILELHLDDGAMKRIENLADSSKSKISEVIISALVAYECALTAMKTATPVTAQFSDGEQITIVPRIKEQPLIVPAAEKH